MLRHEQEAAVGAGVQRTRGRGRLGDYAIAGLVAVGGVALGAVLFPLDGAIASLASSVRGRLGGDVVRELESLQQFGAVGSVLLISAAVWLLDPSRRRRLLDWLAGIVLAALVVMPMKMLVGRPRPKFGDPIAIPGPFGAYPLGPERGVRSGWEVGADISSDLWSMPSSHTAHAVVAAVFLGVVYPRLRPLVIGLALLVGACRVLFAAHYPSDVAVGAGLGFAAGWLAARRFAGVRALDFLWKRMVDRGAGPAFPSVYRSERRASSGGRVG